MGFELADRDKIEELQEYVDKILEAIGHPEALVTDESKIFDFVFSEDDESSRLVTIALNLGVPVAKSDYLIDIAKRMRDKDERILRKSR